MQKPFLQLIAEHIRQHYKNNTERLCIVLPGKRGALFLKHHLGKAFAKTIWLPEILTSEELIAKMSDVKLIEEIDLLCHLYESYRVCYGENAESFDSFARWGQLILQDFNEIDRYLADPAQLYDNLKDIKVLEQWSLGEEDLTEFQKNYLRFMSSLGAIYRHFNARLIQNKWAYQGLAYRKAVENKSVDFKSKYDKILFCGFNALNEAEINIYKHLFKSGIAEMFWDGDPYYVDNPDHEAGHFLRKNLDLFPQKESHFIEHHFQSPKTIDIISVPKQIGQAQVVKQTVQKYIDNGVSLDSVAIVLANEKLLWPVLKQLPDGVKHVNVTMEYPLKYTSTFALLDSVLQLQLNYRKQNRKEKQLYYQDLLSLLDQPLLKEYLRACGSSIHPEKLIRHVHEKNLAFLNRKKLTELFENETHILSLILEELDLTQLTKSLEQILSVLQEHFRERSLSAANVLEQEYLDVFLKNFNRLKEITGIYGHFHDIRSYRQLFMQVVGNASAPFVGEPLKGLQIMGVLETRTLDFKHLILVNINESVLPAGKSTNSFIPNDLKRAFNLPLYSEKDAIFSYHFYRLLQRADDITITYDSETDTFGKGEKSRFITQLQIELSTFSDTVKIREMVATDLPNQEQPESLISIPKTPESLERVYKKACTNDVYHTLSPSSLIVFMDCPLKFYFRYGTGLKELKSVEESAESNTFGIILHESLEILYTPIIGKTLDTTHLNSALGKTGEIVKECFIRQFGTTELTGKSILQYEVIKHYAEKQLKRDRAFILDPSNKNRDIKILALEKKFVAELQVSIQDKIETVFISGKIDRIDQFGEHIRIIDYKNSVSKDDRFSFSGFTSTFTEKEYHKQFQLLMYSWLLFKNNYCAPEKMQPGIIAFRSQEDKFHTLTVKSSPLVITSEFMQEFELELRKFIESIFENGHFNQTDNQKTCEFCDYSSICIR